MARRRNSLFADLVTPSFNNCCCHYNHAPNIDNCSDTQRPMRRAETSFKSVESFKKEWKTLKQVGWGGQGSIFQVSPLVMDRSKCTTNTEYVAKIMYFTDESVYPSVEDRKSATRSVMDEYTFVVKAQLLRYTDFYYDPTNHYKAVIVMEKLSHCLSHKRDSNWNGIYRIQTIAKDIAYNMKQIHDLHRAHFDIKKENIMYNEREMKWQLIDYGFLRYIDPQKGYIRIEKFIGTKAWTAPEIKLLSEMEYEATCVSQKCDIYSYGLVLLNIALGRYHYGVFEKCGWLGHSELEILKKLNTEKGNALLQKYLVSLKKNGVIETDLYALLSQILVFDPAKRPTVDGILCMKYLQN